MTCRGMEVQLCHLQGGLDPVAWPDLGMRPRPLQHQMEDEAAGASHGVQI